MTSPASPAQPISDELAEIRERDANQVRMGLPYAPGSCVDHRHTLLLAYDQQSAEIARLAKDAARYRWLRDVPEPRCREVAYQFQLRSGNAFDEYIDNEMALAPASVTP